MRPVLPEQGFAVELGGQGLVFGGHSLSVTETEQARSTQPRQHTGRRERPSRVASVPSIRLFS
jgi:hypothetical protein